jgi:hypothetical protein
MILLIIQATEKENRHKTNDRANATAGRMYQHLQALHLAIKIKFIQMNYVLYGAMPGRELSCNSRNAWLHLSM